MRTVLPRGSFLASAILLARALGLASSASAQVFFTEHGDTVTVSGDIGDSQVSTSPDVATLSNDNSGCIEASGYFSWDAYLVEPAGSRFPGAISDWVHVDITSACIGYMCSEGCVGSLAINFTSFPDDASPQYPPDGVNGLAEDGTPQSLAGYFYGTGPPMPVQIYVQSDAPSLVSVGATDHRLPTRFALAAPWPNPSRGPVTLNFDVPRTAHVSLVIHDVAGRVVRRLVDESRSPGHYTTSWDGRDESGRTVAAGIYLVRLAAPGVVMGSKSVIVQAGSRE